MPPIDLIKLWFEKHIRFATWSDVETAVNQPHTAEIRFSTARFTYTISADTNEGEDYLGCVCVERDRRRGCDLPDGPFSEATWRDIVEAMIENEIIPTRSPGGRGC